MVHSEFQVAMPGASDTLHVMNKVKSSFHVNMIVCLFVVYLYHFLFILYRGGSRGWALGAEAPPSLLGFT